ncbi:hypothetical protein BDD12DRAFT_503648 [Trichophaea hybrida]|nr:hypothetical protein BDD12DRAFT_503648 [Trichophaea hybrida]
MSGASTLRPRRRPPPPFNSSLPPPSTLKPPTPPPPQSPPAETLVYIHPITPTTTLSGVIIAFDTTASSILRTNSLWPGDPLQSRRSLLIPVDDCRIRGTPLPPPEEEVEEGVGYKVHSRCLLPNGIGPTTIGVLLPRRRGRRKVVKKEDGEEEEGGKGRPKWMTPGVHSFHPEEEVRLPEMVEGGKDV